MAGQLIANHIIVAVIGFVFISCEALASDEISTVEKLQNTIKTMESMLEKQQKRLLSGFDGMRKRVHVLEKMAGKTKKELEHNTNIVCPPLPSPTHGRVLGARKRSAGDLAFYVCNSSSRLIGNEERVCFENGTWSGSQPRCQSVFPVSGNQFIRNSDCVNGTPEVRTCSCPIGFQISSDQDRCIDVDECRDIVVGERIMRIADCQYQCRNQPGSYECLCPSGYILNTDRRCQDEDECAAGSDNCSSRHRCINNYGGFECISAGCPAQYIKTGERTCQKIPCAEGEEECRQLPYSITYHYMAITPNVEIPTKIFRLSTEGGSERSITRFSVVSGDDSIYFTSRREDRKTGWLILSRRPDGPTTLHVEFEAREHSRTGHRIATHLTKIAIYVSGYSY